jgi:DNA-binding PadR family transcriptional regulator
MSEMYENIVKCFAYLSIIVELSKGKEITGYDILNHVSSFGLTVSAGTVYHQLGMLEKAGLIKPKPVRRKRGYKAVYVMTEKGMATFEEFKAKWRKPLEYAARSLI